MMATKIFDFEAELATLDADYKAKKNALIARQSKHDAEVGKLLREAVAVPADKKILKQVFQKLAPDFERAVKEVSAISDAETSKKVVPVSQKVEQTFAKQNAQPQPNATPKVGAAQPLPTTGGINFSQ